ncbi:hypothetical protein [Noviherbaspirillum sp.]|uniref:hypothetical protein n=1 Tax=Noviherbaspirillum sp. TaxID=1926288 RepID=UPI002B483A56|nr:hypothetical protein [Noviherbaspirillum sp.]HJV83406.1 hypothetical protein [Noviherbaspirillum sp.]
MMAFWFMRDPCRSKFNRLLEYSLIRRFFPTLVFTQASGKVLFVTGGLHVAMQGIEKCQLSPLVLKKPEKPV